MIRLQIKIPNAKSIYLTVDSGDNLKLLREHLRGEKVKVFDESELTLLHPPKTLILKRDEEVKFADLGITHSATFIFKNPKIVTMSKNEKWALERAEFKEKMRKIEAEDKVKEKKRRDEMVENILAEVEADRRRRAERRNSREVMRQLQDVSDNRRDPNLVQIRLKPSNGEMGKVVEISSQATLGELGCLIRKSYELTEEETVILQNPLQQTSIKINDGNESSPLSDHGISGAVFFILNISRVYIKKNLSESTDEYSD